MECALVFKSVYHLSLRAAQGFLSSVMELRRLTLPIPDYSTVSRRQTALAVRSALTPSSNPRHVIVDATGLKVYGAGEGWRATRSGILQQIAVHGRSTWRRLSRCTRQSIAENAMFRFQRWFGEHFWARSLATQRVEAAVKCVTLNRMTQLGMPETVRVA
jgi:hypothetical protein